MKKKKIIIITIIVFITLIIFLYLSSLTKLSVFFDYSELSVFNSKKLCKGIINNYESNKCLIKLAKHRKDETICNESFKKTIDLRGNLEIPPEEFKSECYRGVAIEKRDVELCEKAIVGEQRNYCIQSIARYTNNIDYCDLLPNEANIQYGPDKDTCYREVESFQKNKK